MIDSSGRLIFWSRSNSSLASSFMVVERVAMGISGPSSPSSVEISRRYRPCPSRVMTPARSNVRKQSATVRRLNPVQLESSDCEARTTPRLSARYATSSNTSRSDGTLAPVASNTIAHCCNVTAYSLHTDLSVLSNHRTLMCSSQVQKALVHKCTTRARARKARAAL